MLESATFNRQRAEHVHFITPTNPARSQPTWHELSAAQLDALYAYLELLIKWNKAYNLTAIREPERMVSLHLLDSLAVHPYVQNAQRIIDVGTGPGLPGIVLAIMNPSKDFTLLDSNGKKTRFYFKQNGLELGQRQHH